MTRSIAGVFFVALMACVLGGCGGGGGGGGGGNEGVISFTTSGYSVNEDGTVITTITVQRVGGSGDVSVVVTLTDGTATAPGDYDPTPVTLVWLAGDVSNKTFVVPIGGDHVDEPDETVTMTLGSPTGGAAIGSPGSATLTIVDDDVAGTVQFDMGSYTYTEAGTTVAPVTVTRTGGVDGDIFVTVTAIDGTANSDPLSFNEGEDYFGFPIQVFFADQSTTPVIVPVMIVNDGLPEQDEVFTVQLVNPTNGATLGAPSSAPVGIIDDDTSFELQGSDFNGFFGTSLTRLGPILVIGAPGNDTHGEIVLVGGTFFGFPIPAEPFAHEFGKSVAAEGLELVVGSSGKAHRYHAVLDIPDLFHFDLSTAGTLLSTLNGFGATSAYFQGRPLVGAPAANADSGAVDVFSSGGNLLDTIAGEPLEKLGSAFGVDGANRVAIGVPGGTGAVELYTGIPGGALALDLVINNPFPSALSPAFGASVAVKDDLIVVGAPDEDTLATNDGRVYLFDTNGLTTWLPPGLPIQGGRFGANVFITSEGFICVQQEGGASGTGRVFVYDRSGAIRATFDTPNVAAGADFGASMLELDGALVIGAPKYPFLVQTGTIFMFRLPHN